ncbi:hypothetical protein P3T76_003657 [Phytophthora citrophthora]|uniref:Uncharacterized protein n=1 Tax=Phytophthora citrophthora TaxID=4793 RepID=A0AAD9GV03_9STRA|nr:hypothetical protein P3T76_003657 [Phytophthora citrophthora]
MLPLYEGKTENMSGASIADFLVVKEFKVSPSTISRIKQNIHEGNSVECLTSFHKLESYLKLLAEKNPGSIWRLEKESNGTFAWACFIPLIGAYVSRMARRRYELDGAFEG